MKNNTRLIAITNQKGGVAKTTSAINISAALARENKKILLIDLDPQHNLTVSLGIEAHKLDLTIYDLLSGTAKISDVVKERNGIYVIPSSLRLSAADLEFSSTAGREFILKESISEIQDYDFLIFDCPPSLGILTLNALTAANEVFIPVQAEYLALQGISMLMDTIKVVRSRLNPSINISGVFATRYDARKNLNREVLDYLKENFKDKLFKTVIRDNISLAESISFGQTIFEYKEDSNGASDYMNLAKEILSMKR